MCGICGYCGSDTKGQAGRPLLERMNATIRHRGPDSDGFHLASRGWSSVGLAMRRLAIVDLNTGDQPMANEDGSVWIVFNGEIYNYPELRPELQARGHTLQTRSDTEAILHLYEDYGLECVQHLRGMFAFAIWDQELGQLLLARDRVGKKPLYYAESDGTLLFGSELKCLLQYPGLPRVVDLEAIHHYLTLQYVPDPWTAYQGVYKLPPAHRLIWRDGVYKVECYWDLAYEPKLSLPLAEAQQQVRQTVAEAVRIRLMSDVPLGAHLSGGIDSSIIVGLMAGLMDRPVKTFSIGFDEDKFNELPYARAVAQRFGTEHHEFTLKPDAVGSCPGWLSILTSPLPIRLPSRHGIWLR